MDIVGDFRKKYHDASHVCYAFRLGEGVENYFRVNDDGEPNGTAGMPIYNEIKHREYFNILVVVVRYFGGTKLGTGGLARAYQQAACLVINKAIAVTQQITRSISLQLPFRFQGEIHNLLGRFKITNVGENYSANGIQFKLAVPLQVFTQFQHQVTEVGKGEISWEED